MTRLSLEPITGDTHHYRVVFDAGVLRVSADYYLPANEFTLLQCGVQNGQVYVDVAGMRTSSAFFTASALAKTTSSSQDEGTGVTTNDMSIEHIRFDQWRVGADVAVVDSSSSSSSSNSQKKKQSNCFHGTIDSMLLATRTGHNSLYGDSSSSSSWVAKPSSQKNTAFIILSIIIVGAVVCGGGSYVYRRVHAARSFKDARTQMSFGDNGDVMINAAVDGGVVSSSSSSSSSTANNKYAAAFSMDDPNVHNDAISTAVCADDAL
jgi:hypothetical protein